MSVINITKDNFASATEKGRVLLDFWAPWCGPCRMVAPVVEEIAAENESITVGKVNVDEQIELAQQFRVSSIPTLVVLENGKTVATSVGYRPKEELERVLGI